MRYCKHILRQFLFVTVLICVTHISLQSGVWFEHWQEFYPDSFFFKPCCQRIVFTFVFLLSITVYLFLLDRDPGVRGMTGIILVAQWFCLVFFILGTISPHVKDTSRRVALLCPCLRTWNTFLTNYIWVVLYNHVHLGSYIPNMCGLDHGNMLKWYRGCPHVLKTWLWSSLGSFKRNVTAALFHYKCY